MLPTHGNLPGNSKIFVNPNFQPQTTQTHINPRFLAQFQQQKPLAIYVNPAFIKNETAAAIPTTVPTNLQKAELIVKSRTKLIRKISSVPKPPTSSNILPPLKSIATSSSPLVKIGLRKLVRSSTSLRQLAPHNLSLEKRKTAVHEKTKKFIGRTKSSFVSRFALSRTPKENLTPIKVRRINKSVNKKLEFLTINGVVYKSTANKLQRKTSESEISTKQTKPTGRALIVRGNKFIIGKNGLNLTRVEGVSTPLRRIDIGGLTYVAKSKNVFIRTDLHHTRNHLTHAKAKSINVLSKNLVKTNIPCPLFQRLGKCVAKERGKCPKVHDKNQVIVCTKFLRGECTNARCLLSHNVSLSKMPVCKFFLQGLCVREDCPYLHKKLSENAQICLEFQRGFCHLADNCNKRHEFINPKPTRTKMKRQKTPVKNIKAETDAKHEDLKEGDEEKTNIPGTRYFVGEDNEDISKNCETPTLIEDLNDSTEPQENVVEVEVLTMKRPKLGVLPSYIPL